jgi:hypothetical protein
MSGESLSPQEKLKQSAASGEVIWDRKRKPLINGSTYTCIPPWIANNTGLDADEAKFKPGYTPEGQTVVVEDEAIIIRTIGDGDE